MFIDAHLHVVRTKGLPRNTFNSNFPTPEELLEIMDRTGIDKGILLPGSTPDGSYQQTTTEDVLEVCETHPDRFYAFCNVDPRAGSNSPESDLSFQINYYKSRGCLGVGEITASLEISDPLVQNLFHHCEKCEMPVIFHLAPKRYNCYGLIDTIGLQGLEAALGKFDKLVFIGHSPPFWAEISADVTEENRNSYPEGPIVSGGTLPRLMETYPNLYCGWDALSGYYALTRDPEFGWEFMEKYNDRILFGTDICDPNDKREHAQYLRTSHADGRISNNTFENISWRNANRLFRLGL